MVVVFVVVFLAVVVTWAVVSVPQGATHASLLSLWFLPLLFLLLLPKRYTCSLPYVDVVCVVVSVVIVVGVVVVVVFIRCEHWAPVPQGLALV